MSGEAEDIDSQIPKPKSPASIVDRESEWRSITSVISEPGSGNIHIHGSRGSGKTLIAQRAIDAISDSGTAYYIPCYIFDTQYQVLKKIFEQITNKRIPDGLHTSQIQQELLRKIKGQEVVITLDEIDFLLLNDGSDIIYYLTRSGLNSISIVTISANLPDLASKVDERTYSSLHPQNIRFESYSESEATKILLRQASSALERYGASGGAISNITSQTTNVRHGLHWLAIALKQCENELTGREIDDTRTTGLHRYWDTLLADFSDHHQLLLDAIKELTTDKEEIQTGEIYKRYKLRCRKNGMKSLTSRRISDFLKHLELLGIIQADYHYGGKRGKTRDIRLNNSII